MATIADMLRQLGNNAAPQGGNALVGPITLPAYAPSPLAIAVPAALSRNWSRATGRPTEAQHALALAAARAGEGVALMGHEAVPHDDLLLITLAQLLATPRATALWLTPDKLTLQATAKRLERIEVGVRWQVLGEQAQRGTTAQLTLLTYDDLHRRVLQWADRAWRWLWPSLHIIALPALQQAAGPTGGHLQWLLRRVERLAGPVQLLVALAPVAAADSMLPRLLDRPMRLIAASTGPTTSTLVALWHSGSDRRVTLRHLAGALSRHHLALTVLGRDAFETAALHASLGDGIAVGLGPDAARVAVVAGVPPDDNDRQHLLRAGYRLLLMLAGDTPHEQLLLAQPELLGQALPAWPLPRGNPLINAAELVCVAGERPLSVAEVEDWQVGEQVRKLVEQGQLQALAPGEAWQPAAAATDPYERLDPYTVRGQAITVARASGEPYGFVTPGIAERWGLVGAVWSPGWVVESSGNAEVILAPSSDDHATWPHEEVRVIERAELAKRSLQWKQRRLELRRITVSVRARVQGLIELELGQRQRERPVARSAERQWSAVALALPVEMPNEHVAAGWALLTTLPLIANTTPGALLPWYDREHGQLLVIEVDPGGIGLVEALYGQMERWLELARQQAQACATDSLYAAFARSELQWLEALRVKAQTAPAVVTTAQQPVAEMPVAAPVVETTKREPPRVQPLPPPQPPEVAQAQRPRTPVVRMYAVPATAMLVPGAPTVPPLATDGGEPPVVAMQPPEEQQSAEEQRQQAEVVSAPVVQTELPTATVMASAEVVHEEPQVADIAWEPDVATAADEVEDIAWEAELPPPLPFPTAPRPVEREAFRRPTPPRYAPARSPRQAERPFGPPRPPNPSGSRPVQPRPPAPTPPVLPHEQQRMGVPPHQGGANEQRPTIVPPRGAPADGPAAIRNEVRRGPEVTRRQEEEQAGDVGGMIARLRRLRSTRDEAGVGGRAAPPATSRDDEAGEPRFKRGDRVQCVPYGEGRVVESAINGGREQVRIDFGEDGIIEVDPAISLVRRLEQPTAGTSEEEQID